MLVTKRDGSKQKFVRQKIIDAIDKAGGHGVQVYAALVHQLKDDISVEEIQDIVEQTLMIHDPATAKRYVIYRYEHAVAREHRVEPDPLALSQYIHKAKYAKYLPDLGVREEWEDTVDRCMEMMPYYSTEIRDAVLDKRILPSMRALQFAGGPIEQHNARLYNCSFTHIDRPRAFQEVFYLLLCGCGVGFSVQKHHVAQLPRVEYMSRLVKHFTIQDSIEGWSDAIGELIDAALTGYWVEFDYQLIRPEGAPLLSGGKAPGHQPLKHVLEKVRSMLLTAQGRQLKTLECHDVLCYIAEAVLSGGIRRSSLISLFTLGDEDMRYCKNDDWLDKHAQRAMANNSVVLLRSCSREDFDSVMQDNPYGEPGFFFTDDLENGCNPCGEIMLTPIKNGFGFCNLTEINAAKVETKEQFWKACQLASELGTMQATFTEFPYLHPASEEGTRRDALLGVSITGIMDNPKIFNPEWLDQGRQVVIETNKLVAAKLGINPAKRFTTIKPSGTASLLLNCSAGIHPHHSRRYFRRVTANRHENMAKAVLEQNPHMVDEKPNGDLCITFPVQVSDQALTVKDMTTREFMDFVFLFFDHWIVEGHNISCTVSYDDFDATIDYVWQNRHRINAMSFLPFSSDKGFPYMPREEVLPEDESKWQSLVQNFVPIQWPEEDEDNTATLYQAACDGDTCDVVANIEGEGYEVVKGGDLTSVMGMKYSLRKRS